MVANPLLAKGNRRHDDSKETYIPVATFDRQSTASYGDANVASTISARDYKSPSDLVAIGVTGDVAHTLKAEGADASEDGTGRGTPIVAFQSKASASQSMNPGPITPALDVGKSDGLAICFTAKDYGADAQEDIAPTLRAGGHKDSHQNGGVGPAIAFSIMPQNSGKDYKAREVDVAQPVMASGQSHGNQGGDVILQPVTVALRGGEGGATAEPGGEVATAMRASSGGGDKPHVLTSAVRRLTPRECERLQGFPDDYTRIPVRHYKVRRITKLRPEDMWERAEDGGWWLMAADGPRYKQLGNSWAVPKFRWLGERIAKHMPVATNATTETKKAA